MDEKKLEEALQVRDILLRVLLYGVSGSKVWVGTAEFPGRVQLARLLQYSANTRRHKDAFKAILNMVPKSNLQISENYSNLSPEGDNGVDLVYAAAEYGKNHVFNVAYKHTSTPFWMSLDHDLIVHLMQNNGVVLGLWEAGYTLFDFAHSEVTPGGMEDNLHPSNVYPEKNQLLQFFISPERLSGEKLLSLVSSSKIVEENRQFVAELERDGFRHLVYQMDGFGVAARLEDALTEIRSEILPKEIDVLKTRGVVRYCIVEIGTATIGGKLHYIYTGSEAVETNVKF